MVASADNDALSNRIAQEIFPQSAFAHYKHFCGEHYSASAFATVLAARMLENRYIPDEILIGEKKNIPNTILIFNQSGRSSYSLILLKLC